MLMASSSKILMLKDASCSHSLSKYMFMILQKKIWLEKEKKIQLSVTSIGIAVLPKYTNITPLIVSKKKKSVENGIFNILYININILPGWSVVRHNHLHCFWS